MEGQEPPEVSIALTNGNQPSSRGLMMSKITYNSTEPASMNSSMLSALFSRYTAETTLMVGELLASAEEFSDVLADNSSLNYVLFEFKSMLEIPTEGEWQFAVRCSDACELRVDGVTVAFQGGANNFSMSNETTDGQRVELMAGKL
eukprot:3661830-Rhodomonas_salina.1